MLVALFGFELIFITALIFLAVAMFASLFGDAPFVPTGRKTVRAIMEIARVKPGEVFFDLGAGDGRLVRAAARAGATAYGFERVSLLVLWANLLAKAQGLSGRATVSRGNIFEKKLGDADIIFIYLFPEAMAKLEEKCRRELKPGARLFSRAFAFPRWRAATVHRIGKYAPAIYEYRQSGEFAPDAFLP